MSRVDAWVSTTLKKKDVMNGEAEGDEVACMFWSWAAVCLKKKFFQFFDHSL